MSERPHQQTEHEPDEPARVVAVIEEARKDRMAVLDLSNENLTELPESLGQ
jgi:hypothetical protein